MAIILQEPITGSDATYTTSGVRVALDVDIGSNIVVNIGSVSATVDSVFIQSGANVLLYGVSSDVGSVGGIVGGAETAIVQHILTGSYSLTGFDATGTADAQFRVYHNTTLQAVLRNNPAQRNVEKTFNYPLQFTTGSVVLKAKHAESTSQGYEATLYGVDI